MPFAGVARHRDAPPFRGELDGVRQEVQEDLANLALVADKLPEAVVDRHVEPEPVAGRALADEDHGAPDGRREIEAGELQLHPPRLDLRQVQDVVDEREEMAARGEDVLDVLGLLVVELSEHALPEHLREADDRVERRAELVRHVGEELGLVAAGGLELPALV